MIETRPRLPIVAALLPLGFLLVHCGGDPVEQTQPPPSDAGADAAAEACTEAPAPSEVAGFSRYALDSAAFGPAYAAAGDMNGDGKTDILIAKFGTFKIDPATSMVTLSPGLITLYTQGTSASCWSQTDIINADDKVYFPNQPALADVDKDGDLDVIVAAGFFVCAFDPAAGSCGALAWLENTGQGFVRHDVVPYGDDKFYHEGIFVDFDGDGIEDLVTVGETADSATARWFKGDTSKDRFSKTPLDIGASLGSFPSVLDIDKDGDLDVASAEYFVNKASFAWLERTAPPSAGAPAGTFERRVINSDSGKSIQLRFVPDLYGDGVLRAVGTNHTNTNKMPPDPAESAVLVLDVPAAPKDPWPKKQISTGIVSRPNEGFSVQAAPGVFGAGDVDNDGDIDVVVSGDGDIRTFWLEQTAPGAFTTHVIEEKLGQAGGTLVVDLDKDGKNEVIFTGYEDNAVYIYKKK